MSTPSEMLWISHGLTFVLSLLAFAALALAMERHQQDVWGRELASRHTRWLRAAGWLLLLLALWPAVAAQGWGEGLVAYSGHTSAAAGLVFCALLGWSRLQDRRRQRGRSSA